MMLAVTVLGAIVMFIAQRTGAGKRSADLRRRYLEYLVQLAYLPEQPDG